MGLGRLLHLSLFKLDPQNSFMISLSNERTILIIDPDDGGRVVSLVIDGYELLRDEKCNEDKSIFGYGSFPMAPYAGRIRHGKFEFDGEEIQLENLADAPHALHGTAIYQKWKVIEQTDLSCVISTDIKSGWPYQGIVTQKFMLQPNTIGMTMVLTAIDRMPAWLGFHPWFRKEISGVNYSLKADFEWMYVRDNQKVATPKIVRPKPLPWDDCFVGDNPNVEISWGDLLQLKLRSNWKYWVIYSEKRDAICLEPQTAPPNAIELNQCQILNAGDSMELEFQINF